MSLVKAVLIYRPVGIGSEESVPIGSTADTRVLRTVRDRLVEEAHHDAETWRDVDVGIYVIRLAEAERLGRILRILLPEESLRPALQRVRSNPPTPKSSVATELPRSDKNLEKPQP